MPGLVSVTARQHHHVSTAVRQQDRLLHASASTAEARLPTEAFFKRRTVVATISNSLVHPFAKRLKLWLFALLWRRLD